MKDSVAITMRDVERSMAKIYFGGEWGMPRDGGVTFVASDENA